jgi:hypothetical protein
VGQRFIRLGLNPDIGKHITAVVQVVVDDSFKANTVVFRSLRQRIQNQVTVQHLALNFKCGVHLGNLIRKSLVLSIPGFWSTVVRLGHLFSLCRFRRLFIQTMRSVIAANFAWVPVASLPANSVACNLNARNALNLWSDEPGDKPSKRFLDLMALLVLISILITTWQKMFERINLRTCRTFFGFIDVCEILTSPTVTILRSSWLFSLMFTTFFCNNWVHAPRTWTTVTYRSIKLHIFVYRAAPPAASPLPKLCKKHSKCSNDVSTQAMTRHCCTGLNTQSPPTISCRMLVSECISGSFSVSLCND